MRVWMCVECECRGECESACTRMRASASARDKISTRREVVEFDRCHIIIYIYIYITHVRDAAHSESA